jgi:predicted nucleic acid-binding protein
MSAERFSIDTNLLIYAVDRREGDKHFRALDIVDRAAALDCVLTAQSLGEFVTVTTRRRMLSKPSIMAQVRDWLTAFPMTTARATAFATAFSAFEAGRFALWDALLLATAAEAGCTIVLSEDMGDGATLDGITRAQSAAGQRPAGRSTSAARDAATGRRIRASARAPA